MQTLSASIINREASDKAKGFRLQKIRAIKLMLETIRNDSNSVFFTAIEHHEDVYHQTIQDGVSNTYMEEDKNYDLSSNFTIFSSTVLNTLVSFFDRYINELRFSKKVYFGFYTTRSIGKEKKHILDNGVELILPKEPILSLLASKQKLDDDVIILIISILRQEYSSQYSSKDRTGYLDILDKLGVAEFSEFLKQITWCFGQEDEISLKESVVSLIKISPLYNSSHIGKEEFIFSALMEMLDEKQNKGDIVEKLTTKSDVEIIFRKAEKEPDEKTIDPSWQELTTLTSQIKDKRNLEDKIRDVVNDYPKRNMEQLARKACCSKNEQMKLDRTFLSAKYRVFLACEDYMLSNNYSQPTTKLEIDSVINNLNLSSIDSINELKKDYSYTVSNNKTIEGIVLDLFDCCFLSFENRDELDENDSGECNE